MSDPRDPLDETLSRGLRALAPSEFELDADAALGSMRPAFQRARARRRLAVSTSALGVVVALAAGAVVLQHQPASRVDIRSHTRPTVSTSVKTPTSTTPTVATSTSQPHVISPQTTPHPSTTTVPGNPKGGGSIPGGANGGSLPRPTTTAPPGSTPTTPGDHGGTTPTTVAPSTKSYSAIGGQATIRFANGALTLASYTAAAGYTPEVHTNTATDIEIRFSNGSAESRIRVRVDNGQLRPEITEN